MKATCVLCIALLACIDAASPVQKVIEMLDGMKVKIESDLKTEAKGMEEYSAFCDDELAAKGYAIKDATRKIMDLKAVIEDSKASIAERDSEIVALGTEMSGKDQDLAAASAERHSAHGTFEVTEKDLLQTVDMVSRAVVEIKKSMSFMQVKAGGKKHVPLTRKAIAALKALVEAGSVQGGDKAALTGFIQDSNQQKATEDDDLDLRQPQAKMVGYESSSGGILDTMEDMKSKAEASLTEARRSETKAAQSFDMMRQSLLNELKLKGDKKSAATSSKEAASEDLGKAQGELAATSSGKAADEKGAADLSQECQSTAAAWEARQKESSAELGALAKAKEILGAGVKVFVQVGIQSGAVTKKGSQDDDQDDADDRRRAAIKDKLKSLGHEYNSFALMELANSALSDPFVKIKGLIEEMISKLLTQAQQEATHQAFCEEEQGKSKKSQAKKTETLDTLRARTDKATATRAMLTEDIKELEAEVAKIDSMQSEATKLRTDEKAAYTQAYGDFKGSADATERAIVVLKDYYEGSFIQVASSSKKSKQPDFGGARGDAGHVIIEVLSMAAEDFTKTYTELEQTELAAVNAFESQSQDNKVSKAAKASEVSGKKSEVKSLTVALSNLGQDTDSVSKELDAVMTYLDKLKPQCDQKVIDGTFKRRKRNEEIAGLKEALSILDGSSTPLLLQVKQHVA